MVIDETFSMKNVSDEAQEPAVTVPPYRWKMQCRSNTLFFWETNYHHNARHEPGRLTSAYSLFRKEEIADMTEMCGDYLKLQGHLFMFCTAVKNIYQV